MNAIQMAPRAEKSANLAKAVAATPTFWRQVRKWWQFFAVAHA